MRPRLELSCSQVFKEQRAFDTAAACIECAPGTFRHPRPHNHPLIYTGSGFRGGKNNLEVSRALHNVADCCENLASICTPSFCYYELPYRTSFVNQYLSKKSLGDAVCRRECAGTATKPVPILSSSDRCCFSCFISLHARGSYRFSDHGRFDFLVCLHMFWLSP